MEEYTLNVGAESIEQQRQEAIARLMKELTEGRDDSKLYTEEELDERYGIR